MSKVAVLESWMTWFRKFFQVYDYLPLEQEFAFVPYVCLVDVKLLGYLNYLLKFKLDARSGDKIEY